mgnify:CR=1 FL=1
MFFYCRNGQTHFFRYLTGRFFMDTAQYEHALCLRWKLINDDLEIAQFVAREQLGFAVIYRLQ